MTQKQYKVSWGTRLIQKGLLAEGEIISKHRKRHIQHGLDTGHQL